MSFAKEYSKTTEKRRSYLDNFNSHTKELEPAKAHFQGFYVSVLPQRSWQHCPQLRDLLRVSVGAGSDALAKAVDGRAKAMQLDVVGFGESRMCRAPLFVPHFCSSAGRVAALTACEGYELAELILFSTKCRERA